ncbi:MAG TPA: hypothetical protein VFW19_07110 [Allosphingosinicella sp.]|nr:hypothetical protein [Allosphingosinicella sp.]
MSEDEDGREKGRYEREVEARFGREDPDADPPAATSRRNPAIAWLIFLVLLAIVVAFCWPYIAPLMHRSVIPTTPPSQARAQPLPGAQSRPKPPATVYPPCTATRTDRCVQKEDGK